MKKNTLLIAILLIIILLQGGFIAYKLYSKENTSNESVQENSVNHEDSQKIEVVNKLVSENKLEQTFKVTLNGVTKDYDVEFSVERTNDGSNEYSIIIGNFAGIGVYASDNIKAEGLTIKSVIDDFIKNNLSIIIGQDQKEYLVLRTFSMSPTGFDSFFIIFDSNGNIVNQNETLLVYYSAESLTLEKSNVWYKDIYGLCKYDEYFCKTQAKIENNKIYSLMESGCPDEPDAVLEERIFTVNNSKLIRVDEGKKYKITGGSGACSYAISPSILQR